MAMDVEMLASEIKQHEGLNLMPYRDSVKQKLTIGYGRNIEDRGITQDEADYFLQNDILSEVDAVSGLTQGERSAAQRQMVDDRKTVQNMDQRPKQQGEGDYTLGYARNISKQGISLPEAERLLENDLRIVEGEAQNKFPWFANLDDTRQRVIANMLYNMGMPTVSGFTDMINALSGSKKDYDRAADAMLESEWAKQVGHRAQVLADMMRKGEP